MPKPLHLVSQTFPFVKPSYPNLSNLTLGHALYPQTLVLSSIKPSKTYPKCPIILYKGLVIFQNQEKRFGYLLLLIGGIMYISIPSPLGNV